MAFKICKRKNDAIRKGLFSSIGRPKELGEQCGCVAVHLPHPLRPDPTRRLNSLLLGPRMLPCVPPGLLHDRAGGSSHGRPQDESRSSNHGRRRITVVRKTACSRQPMSDAFAQGRALARGAPGFPGNPFSAPVCWRSHTKAD
jgi:hypothetical protein